MISTMLSIVKVKGYALESRSCVCGRIRGQCVK